VEAKNISLASKIKKGNSAGLDAELGKTKDKLRTAHNQIERLEKTAAEKDAEITRLQLELSKASEAFKTFQDETEKKLGELPNRNKQLLDQLKQKAGDAAARVQQLERDLAAAHRDNLEVNSRLDKVIREHAACQRVNPATHEVVLKATLQELKDRLLTLADAQASNGQVVDDFLTTIGELQRASDLLGDEFLKLGEYLVSGKPFTSALRNTIRYSNTLVNFPADAKEIGDKVQLIAGLHPGATTRSPEGGFVWNHFQNAFPGPDETRLLLLLNIIQYWREHPEEFNNQWNPLDEFMKSRSVRVQEEHKRQMEAAIAEAERKMDTETSEAERDLVRTLEMANFKLGRGGTPTPAPSSKRGPPAPSSSSSRPFFSVPMEVDGGSSGRSGFTFGMPPAPSSTVGGTPPVTPPRQPTFTFVGAPAPSSASPKTPVRSSAGPSGAGGRGGARRWSPSMDKPMFRSTGHMNLAALQRSLPQNHKVALVTITQKPSPASIIQYKLHACIGHRNRETEEIEFTWNAVFPSELYENEPGTGKNYHYYEMGPRVLPITPFGEIALLNELAGGAFPSTGPLVDDTKALVSVLADFQEYFPGIRSIAVDKGAPVAEFVARVFPQFVKFVQWFHGIQEFTMSAEMLVGLMKDGKERQKNSAVKLKHPQLLLLLPQSCMQGDVNIADDDNYAYPSVYKIVYADLAEETS
jgi:hypothetical protein